MRSGPVAVIAAVAAVIVAVAVAASLRVNGLSTRTEPSAFERLFARAIRNYSIPARARNMANPVAFSADAWTEARAHFADHCASCHANDGSGQTELGRNLFPRAPDMRLAATQNLTDGELYWIVENGIRLTGMPAWGSGGDHDADTWKLVHFIRRLSDLTPEHLQEMQGLNPKSPSEYQEEQDDLRFLRGEDREATSTPPEHHHTWEKP